MNGLEVNAFETIIDLNNELNVSNIIDSQRNMLWRFEKTNEMLVNCNGLSETRFDNINTDVRKYAQQLVQMRNDLDYIFHRIKFIKLKLSQQYPNAFKELTEKRYETNG